MAKRTVIPCVSGQDGPYSSELLLYEDHEIDGPKRRTFAFNVDRMDLRFRVPVSNQLRVVG